MLPVKRIIRQSLYRRGWDLRRFDPADSPWAQLVRQLTVHRMNTVIDVGANVGQFAEGVRDAGFRGRIISFEASRAAHSELQQHAKRDPQWTVAPRMAIGASNGITKINISQNSVSSSVLPMLGTHLAAEPRSAYAGVEDVELRSLDAIADDFLLSTDRVFLKSDVQGFEVEVLRGAARLLSQTTGIQVELSLVPLYDGECLFDQMLPEIRNRGFDLWSLHPGLTDKTTGRLLQVDAIFFRH